MIPHSHQRVMARLRAAGAAGVPHAELSRWTQGWALAELERGVAPVTRPEPGMPYCNACLLRGEHQAWSRVIRTPAVGALRYDHSGAAGGAEVGLGRIVVSATELPKLAVNLVQT